ncbi:MAG: Hsp70 family protein, partial [Myxococcales bacterium]
PGLEVGAVVGEKTSFRFFASSARRDDQPGTMIEEVSELQELPPIESELPGKEGSAGEVLPVGLRASVTEVGTLALELFARDEKHAGSAWKLEFSVRGE